MSKLFFSSESIYWHHLCWHLVLHEPCALLVDIVEIKSIFWDEMWHFYIFISCAKQKRLLFLSLIIYTHANICGWEMVSISCCFQHESTQIQFIKFNRIFLFVYKEMANNLPRNILMKINKVYALFGILTCIWNKILSFVGS